jgi:hypothetical protein
MSKPKGNLNSAYRLNQTFIGVTAVALGATLIAFVRPMLPDKYDFDSRIIQVLAQGKFEISDMSFQRVADIYSFLGLANASLPASVLGLLMFLVLCFLALQSRHFSITTVQGVLAGSVSFLCGVVFLGTYSKEFILVIFLSLFFLLSSRKQSILGPFMVLLAYGLLFRSYWIAISFIWLFALLIIKRFPKLGKPWIALVILGVVFLMFPIVAKLFNYDVSSLRLGLNEFRIGSNVATTAIVDFLPNEGPILQILNTVLIAMSMIVPIPLLAQFNLIYVTFFLVILSVSVIFIRNFVQKSRLDQRAMQLGLLVVVVFSIQVFFEPDYGSYLRHLTPLLPFFLFLASSKQEVESESGKFIGMVQSNLQNRSGQKIPRDN